MMLVPCMIAGALMLLSLGSLLGRKRDRQRDTYHHTVVGGYHTIRLIYGCCWHHSNRTLL